MPYYRNARTLPAVVAALADQRVAPLEVIVVDDSGDHEAEPVAAGCQAAGLCIRCLRSDRRGQSGATNVGMNAAQGDVVLLTCADIVADRELVAVHRAAHQDASDEVAVVGRLPYADNVAMTPFMRYLSETRTQFSFEDILDAEDVSPLYCYAPNFSVRRATVRRIRGFDERFVYGYQDTDLGRRLAQLGVRFVYRAAAVGFHDHPTDLGQFVRRQYSVGDATLVWLEKWQNADERAKVRQVVATYMPFVDKIDQALADVTILERRLPAQGHLPALLRERLFNLYTLVTNTAILVGMLRQTPRLERLLGQPLAELAPR